MRAPADMFGCWLMHQVRMVVPKRGDARFASGHKLVMAALKLLRHFCGYVRGQFHPRRAWNYRSRLATREFDDLRHRENTQAKRIVSHITAAAILKTRANFPSGERL